MPRGLPVAAIARAMRVLEQLPAIDSTDELDQRIAFLFLRREAVESSRMEGTWSTIDHVLTPGELYDENEGRTERASVLGYAHALEAELRTSIPAGVRSLTPALVCRLHREVMSRDPGYQGRAGQIRRPGRPGEIVFIGGTRRREEAVFNPTPPRHVERCLNEVMEWLSDDELAALGDAGMGIPLPVRLALGHSHFEAVHPFSDGNGRVGRMIMSLQMAYTGRIPLYLSGFIEAEKRDYIRGLEAAQKKLNYGPMVEFICDAISASHREAQLTRKLILSLPDNWRARGPFRRGSAADRSLAILLGCPILTAKMLQDALQVSPVAAQRAISQLRGAGILRERTGFRRNRVFAAEEVIQILSRRFGEDPALALEHARDLTRRQR
jgi:Fic family protein